MNMKKTQKMPITMTLQIILASLVIWVLTSCAITEKPIGDRQVAPDASTPVQYETQYNNGILAFEHENGTIKYFDELKKDEKGTSPVTAYLITDSKRKDYNTLIELYKVQLKKRVGREIKKDDGITAVKDKYGNAVWRLDVQHGGYMKMMLSWQRAGYNADSIIDRVTN